MSNPRLTKRLSITDLPYRKYYVWIHTLYRKSGYGLDVLAENPTSAAFKSINGIPHGPKTIRTFIYVYDSKAAQDDDPRGVLTMMCMDIAAVEPACTKCDEHEYVEFYRKPQSHAPEHATIKKKCMHCDLVHKIIGEHAQDGTDGLESYYNS